MATTPMELVSGVHDAPAAVDPYRYGWRYVRRELPDGGFFTEQVPLTLEDVLHPEEGDQVTHSSAHQRRIRYLGNVFSARLRHDPNAVVLDDVRVKWDVPELQPHGPDIMVIVGVRERKVWSTFDVAAEGVRPALIVEVISPETRAIDRSAKLDDYELAGVPLYVLVDAVTRRGVETVRLFGYTLTPRGYQALGLDEQGRLWLEPLRLWLGVAENELVCYDEAGQPLEDYVEVVEALGAAEARIEALEAELRRLRAAS